MRVIVDRGLCQGHGVCCEEAPEVFRLDGEGELELLDDSPRENQRPAVQAAAKYCPTSALTVED